MKSITILVIVFSSVIAGRAQSLPAGGSHVVLPSPNSLSATNETNIDVDLYNGRLNYSVPLHVVKSRDLEIPVTLQYSSDGVKVDDLASDIGLGWQLNAGGVIARVMRGLPDEFDGEHDFTYECPPPNGTCHGLLPAKGFLDANVGDYSDISYFASASRSETERKQIVEFSNRTGKFVALGTNGKVWDTEPDEFYFNFDRYSGKFVFDKDGEIQIIPHQNLLITKTTSNNLYSYNQAGSRMITSFLVTDDRGIKYTFGNKNPASSAAMTAIDVTKYSLTSVTFQLGYIKDQTASYQQPINFFFPTPVLIVDNNVPNYWRTETPNKQTFTSSWHLTKIESPTGDYIDLDYINEEIKYITGRTHDVSQLNLDIYEYGESYRFGTDKSGDAQPSVSLTGFVHQGQQFTISTSNSTINSKKLNSIVASTGERINLVSSVVRPDLVGAKRIERVIVTNSANEMIKSYEFKYSLMVSPIEEYLYEFKVPYVSGGQFLYPHQFMSPTQLQGFIFSSVPMNIGDWSAMIIADHKRILLSSVAEFFPGTSVEDLVSFEYNTDHVLPPRLSAKQDYYGYHNNNFAGHTLRNTQYQDSFGDSFPVPIVFASLFHDENGDLYVRTSPVDLTEVDDKGKTGSLRNITHKNGSKVAIEYSRNQGFRVSRISSFPDKNLAISEDINYTYGSPQSASITPIFLANYPFMTLAGTAPRANIILSSVPVNQALNKTKGGFIGYGWVERRRTGMGKEVFEFRNPLSNPDGDYVRYLANSGVGGSAIALGIGNYFPYSPKSNADHQRGQLRKKTIYNEANQVLQVDTYQYNINPSGYTAKTIYGLKPGKYVIDNMGWYAASFYKYSADWVYLDYVESKVYDQLDPNKNALTTTRYYYTRSGELTAVPDLLPRKVSTTLPRGDVITNEIKYPLDYTTTATPSDLPAKGIHLLKSKKMEGLPIEGITYLERTEGGATLKYLLGATLIKFKEFQTGKVYPWEAYKLKAGLGNTFTTYAWSTINSNIFTWNNSSNFKFSGSINSYDTYGKPLSQTGEDGIQNALTWGYNNSLLTALTQNTGSYQHRTSYAHSPIIGVTEVTDPNLRKRKYDYDRYRRLKLESDHDNQIITRYRYHNQNQIEGFSNTIITMSGCRMAGQSMTFSSPENLEFGQTTNNWNFGNGSSQSTIAASVIYAYPVAGTYTVGLTKSNPEYASESIQTGVVIYKPIGSVVNSVTGPISYDVCTLVPPAQPTTLFASFRMSGRLPGDAFNVVWEYQFNQSAWVQMSFAAGPISSSFISAPTGFGNPTITGTWSVRCRVEDACGTQYSATFGLTNFASNPNCSRY